MWGDLTKMCPTKKTKEEKTGKNTTSAKKRGDIKRQTVQPRSEGKVGRRKRTRREQLGEKRLSVPAKGA